MKDTPQKLLCTHFNNWILVRFCPTQCSQRKSLWQVAFSFRWLILWGHSKNICTHENMLKKYWELTWWYTGSLKASSPGLEQTQLNCSHLTKIWLPRRKAKGSDVLSMGDRSEVIISLWKSWERVWYQVEQQSQLLLTLFCQKLGLCSFLHYILNTLTFIITWNSLITQPPLDFFSPSMTVVVGAMLCILITYCLSWITFFRQVLFWMYSLALLTFPGQIIYFKYFSHSQYSDRAIH